ncbi:hypothetical protein LY90DRAFT_672048 [Neocallimastix californiae]|jgi:hypothetical protein|uniref:Carotenoid oxygenase n=1 Tax=Neocallimastix californiae TaxID=1754190 RepID=A0A1Y2C3N5_9FUNG|nr:hypothetical protein LY90DRAFT_672048 [Neocallimastix californiae]|eukprot:ORY41504.1 hypothetical protein LY90DRAFT_672048 [Neocallimastix californiae]
MSVSRINSKDELLQHTESSTSIDIDLENDILLEEIEKTKEVNDNVDVIREEEDNSSLFDNINTFGESLMSSVKTRQQLKEIKETIITDSISSFSFGFKNVDKIFPESIELTASKPIPDWLNITYYTLSPARFDFDYTQQREYENVNKTFTIDHLFDVLPLIQKFEINGKNDSEKVQFKSQLLSKGVERKIHESHCISDKVTGLWSHNTNQSSFSRAVIHPLKLSKKSPKPENDIISDNISSQFPSKFHKGAIATLNSTGNVRFVDSNLKGEKIINYIDINSEFKTSYCSPHPIVDPYTGKMINVLGEIGFTSTKFKVVLFDEDSSNLISIVNSPISPIHTFAVTENYIVIISFPMNLKSLNYYTGDSILSTFDYNPEGLTTFYVVSKKEKKHIATFTTKASFGLHIINSYETNKTIWIDFSIYDDDKIIQNLTVENLRDASKLTLPSSNIVRFHLDLNELESMNANLNSNNDVNVTLEASVDHFTKDISIELPTINQKYLGRSYKYAYGVALPFTDPTSGKYYDRIKKIDVESKQIICWNEPHCYPSQPIFIQDPSNADVEDEGVILSSVYDGSKDESFVIILNAKDMTEITRIPLPVPVSPSFSHATVKAN